MEMVQRFVFDLENYGKTIDDLRDELAGPDPCMISGKLVLPLSESKIDVVFYPDLKLKEDFVTVRFASRSGKIVGIQVTKKNVPGDWYVCLGPKVSIRDAKTLPFDCCYASVINFLSRHKKPCLLFENLTKTTTLASMYVGKSILLGSLRGIVEEPEDTQRIAICLLAVGAMVTEPIRFSVIQKTFDDCFEESRVEMFGEKHLALVQNWSCLSEIFLFEKFLKTKYPNGRRSLPKDVKAHMTVAEALSSIGAIENKTVTVHEWFEPCHTGFTRIC